MASQDEVVSTAIGIEEQLLRFCEVLKKLADYLDKDANLGIAMTDDDVKKIASAKEVISKYSEKVIKIKALLEAKKSNVTLFRAEWEMLQKIIEDLTQLEIKHEEAPKFQTWFKDLIELTAIIGKELNELEKKPLAA